jgi:methionine-S-sulfoxide reductase
VSHATYRNHGSHAEAVEVIFDPARVSYRQILEFFFQIHDPSTRNRQGNDVGTSYRSAIFYTSDEQKRIAEDTIADVDASGLWPGTVVTEVVPAGDFWEAEPEHQDYLQRYPDGLFRPAPLETADSHRQGCKAGVTADRPEKRTLGGVQCNAQRRYVARYAYLLR